MTKTIVNQTQPVVAEIIDNILEIYPQPIMREAFADADSRLDLVAYVLSRIPNSYVVFDQGKALGLNTGTPQISQKQQAEIEALIHEAILYHFHKYTDRVA